jgi:CheY-like chemotaxis protein
VLDISRIEAGRLQLSLEPVCVSEALQETLDLMRPLAAQRGINLSNSSSLDDARHVLADRQRFKQVLLNLVTNAIKYSPLTGSVTLSCNDDAGERLRIAVTDTGAGIPEEKWQRLFVPFDRLGAEQSEVQGTGLGLALSKRLMEAMGGEIGMESAVGKGSTFWVELPCAQCPSARLALTRKTKAVSFGSEAVSNQRTVLYIEDNLSNLTLIEQILAEQPDTKLISAMQGGLGLDLAREHSPDVILLDLHLPDLPGWEVLAQLKAEAATRDIPVIVISADATARQIEHLMDAGAHSYLTKPLDVLEFLRALEKTRRPREITQECLVA